MGSDGCLEYSQNIDISFLEVTDFKKKKKKKRDQCEIAEQTKDNEWRKFFFLLPNKKCIQVSFIHKYYIIFSRNILARY